MKFKVLLVLALGVGVVLLAKPVLAHHSFMVEYDMSKPVTVKGIVTKIEYENPHISFYIDVKDEAGRVTNWGFEAASPTALRAHGWTRDSIKPGDHITVEAFRARNGTAFAAARMLTLRNGRQLFAASDGVPPDR
jgi:hypothetical protein